MNGRLRWRYADYGVVIDHNDNAIAYHVIDEHGPLIAAAPELYEALANLLAGSYEDGDTLIASRVTARRALARARGEVTS